MHEFFRPFRRRLGVLVLVVACGFTAMWVRSLHAMHMVCVRGLGIGISTKDGFAISRKVRYQLTPVNDLLAEVELESMSFQATFHWMSYGYHQLEIIHPKLVPYPAVVIPLVVLSAWMLLNTPRRGESTRAVCQ